MEKIALVGPLTPEAKEAIVQLAQGRFEFVHVPTEDEFAKLHDVNYIIIRTLRLNAPAIAAIPGLKLIQRWGVGYDTIDITAAGQRNVPVAIATGINAVPVAEIAVLLMLAVYRNLPVLHQNTINGKWIRDEFISKSYVINGKTVGLVGLGNIGTQVAKIVKSFGAKVQYYDVAPGLAKEVAEMGLEYVGFEELLRTSDIVSLHLPLNDHTRNLIRQETLELMKPSAILINTARGEIIKEDDLVEALRSHRIRGAGLDTFAKEPVAADNPLLKLPNVVATPHLGGNTIDNDLNMAKRCIENITKVSQGERLSERDVVNYSHFKA